MASEPTEKPKPKSKKPLVVVALIVLAVGVFVLCGGSVAGLLLQRSRVVEEPFVQTGEFVLVAGEEGVVNFPLPYRSPPNVEFPDQEINNKTVVTECTATGFKWKNNQKDAMSSMFNRGKMIWKARGLR